MRMRIWSNKRVSMRKREKKRVVTINEVEKKKQIVINCFINYRETLNFYIIYQ